MDMGQLASLPQGAIARVTIDNEFNEIRGKIIFHETF